MIITGTKKDKKWGIRNFEENYNLPKRISR